MLLVNVNGSNSFEKRSKISVFIDFFRKSTFFLALTLAFGFANAQSVYPENVPQLFYNVSSTPEILELKWQGPGLSTGGHLQGIQPYYTKGKKYWIFSGSGSEYGYVAVAQAKSDWLAQHDYVLKFAPAYNHVGGIQVNGKWLVLGIEDVAQKTSSFIRMYDLEEAMAGNIAQGIKIPRQGKEKVGTAGATGIVNLQDGRFMIVVGSWDCETVDLYLSNGKDAEDPDFGFTKMHHWQARSADRSKWIETDWAAYQSLNLIQESSGKVYLIGFAKVKKKQVMDLFEVKWENGIHSSKMLRKVSRREMNCKKGASFRMGAGLFLNAEGKLEIYACSADLEKKLVVNVFR